MPIEVAIWEVKDKTLKKLEFSKLQLEDKLHKAIDSDISIISDELLLIGSEVLTGYGKKIDLLAINIEGNLVVIELKRDRTPRDIVAQVIDYATWVQKLSYNEVMDLFKLHYPEKNFETAFFDKFGTPLPEELNRQHEMMIICSELDSETERIINYLSENYSVPINVAFFRYFQKNGNEFLTRSWLIDPSEVSEKAQTSKSESKKETWNGRDFVGNVDVVDEISSWEDCIKYGFISAGGGRWYFTTLKQLFPGARLFAMIPKVGYLGVGIVKDYAVPISEFKVNCDGHEKYLMDISLKCEGIKKDSDDLEKCEYLVRIEWIKTNLESEAFWMKGLRANQNSAFRLSNQFTLNKLIEHFGLEE